MADSKSAVERRVGSSPTEVTPYGGLAMKVAAVSAGLTKVKIFYEDKTSYAYDLNQGLFIIRDGQSGVSLAKNIMVGDDVYALQTDDDKRNHQ